MKFAPMKIDCDEAGAKKILTTYKKRPGLKLTEMDEKIKNLAEAVAQKDKLLDLFDSFDAVGLHESGLPKIAIAPALATGNVHVKATELGFDFQYEIRGNAGTVEVPIPEVLRKSKEQGIQPGDVVIHSNDEVPSLGRITLQTPGSYLLDNNLITVRLMQERYMQATGVPAHLQNAARMGVQRPRTHTMSSWLFSNATALIPAVPVQHRPKGGLTKKHYVLWEADWESVVEDPLLLEHMGGPIYRVLAEWDVSPIERKIMETR